MACGSKEEAVSAAESGLLWINAGTIDAPVWRNLAASAAVWRVHVYYGTWPKSDFAVLMESL